MTRILVVDDLATAPYDRRADRPARSAFETPRRQLERSSDRAASRRAAAFARIRQLRAERELGRALALLDELAAAEPLDPGVHLVAAMLQEDSGDPEAAFVSARRAMFLDPDSPLAHFLMGSSLLRLEAPSRARVHFRTALATLNALETCDSTPLVEGITAGELRRRIHVRLDGG